MPKILGGAPGYAGMIFAPLAAAQNPELAILIASVITATSYLETAMGTSLAKFLRTNIAMGVTIYNAVRSGGTQRDMVAQAAESFFKDHDHDKALFSFLLDSVKLVLRDRNSVAHALWAWPTAQPDVLLRIPQTSYLAWHEEVSDAQGDRVDITRFDTDAIEIWVATDFNNLLADIQLVERLLRYFWMLREGPLSQREHIRDLRDNWLKIEKREFVLPSLDDRNGQATPPSWPHIKWLRTR